MGKFSEGCLLCGRELVYAAQPQTLKCNICGKEEETYISCTDGHYICDKCHQLDALEVITKYCLETRSIDPVEIATEIMKLPVIKMHGPEHHALVPAAIVTAYRNLTNLIGDQQIKEAVKRGSKIPGGACGNLGACGAGVGTGVAVSVILKATPMTTKSWTQAQLVTARSLNDIALKGGPRCCKRCTWTALEAAVNFFREEGLADFPKTELAEQCRHYFRNQQCQRKKCFYYPKNVFIRARFERDQGLVKN